MKSETDTVPSAASENGVLSSARARIDEIDGEFVRLLADRMDAVRAVGEWKRDHPEAPLRDDGREREIFDVWASAARAAGLSTYFAGRVLREILNYSRRHQERQLHRSGAGAIPSVRVGYQGGECSYSDLAITKLFASRGDHEVARSGYRTFSAVLDALDAGEIGYALLPVENTIAGSINEVYRLLAEHKVHVVDEELWSVDHCLAVKPGTRAERLRTIRSHPVALQQCRRFLDAMVGCRKESWFDTAAAAESVAAGDDETVAALCSEAAAERHGLEIVRREIADQSQNITRFLLVSLEPEPIDPRRPVKTSLVLTLNHRHGALARCLDAFAHEGINLTKLESRPQPDAAWEYLFYVDIEGGIDDPRVERALEEVRSYTNHFRVLGSYPSRTAEGEHDVAPSSVEPETAASAETQAPRVPAACATHAPDPRLPRVAMGEDGQRKPVRIGRVEVGGDRFVLVAGPCAVESRSQILEAAAMVKERGAVMLRGGAFKPRTSPYSFQGLRFEGLDLLAEAGAAYEMPVVTEVLRPDDVDRVAEKADVLQIGARNMQNFELLKKVGLGRRPVLLKRGLSATIDDLLLAAEYVMAGGNHRVILCERGIRTFETATRSTLDVSAVPVLKERTHLPVIVDPSHAAGRRDLVIPLALAAAAAGADGLIVEAHPDPAAALCDKEQALTADDLTRLVAMLGPIVAAQGRGL